MTTTQILDQLNTYQGDNIWQDIILRLDAYDETGTDAIDTGRNDTFSLTTGPIIIWDYQRQQWVQDPSTMDIPTVADLADSLVEESGDPSLSARGYGSAWQIYDDHSDQRFAIESGPNGFLIGVDGLTESRHDGSDDLWEPRSTEFVGWIDHEQVRTLFVSWRESLRQH